MTARLLYYRKHISLDIISVPLKSRGALSQKELGTLLHIQPATVSEFITKLEKKGLVTRTCSDHDKRISKIFLTAKGEETAVKVEKGRQSLHFEILEDLSEEEKDQFFNILTKIKNHFLKGDEKK
ncbi:MAG: MarR family transcriptional regulator [Eubacteriales bacterium]|nr:MarR family transcriptional regulator [Eubacteriales bacterium]